VRLEEDEEELMKKRAARAEKDIRLRLEHITGVAPPQAVQPVGEEGENDIGEWILQNVEDDVFQAATTMKKEQLYALARNYLPKIAHRVRKDRSVLQADALLALIAAHGPGCSSLGQISGTFHLSKNLVQVALEMHTINTIEALAAVFIPSTFIANMKTTGDIPGGRQIVGVVRMVPVRVEIKGKRNMEDTVVPQAFRSEMYGTAAVKLYFGVDQQRNAVYIGSVPGNYNTTRGLCVCPGTGRVAAIRETVKGRDGEITRIVDRTAQVVVGSEIGAATWSALGNWIWQDGATGDAAKRANKAVEWSEPVAQEVRRHLMGTNPCFALKGSVKTIEANLKAGIVMANWVNRLERHGGTLPAISAPETPIPDGMWPELLPAFEDVEDYLTNKRLDNWGIWKTTPRSLRWRSDREAQDTNMP
jgi:hypothetical protein